MLHIHRSSLGLLSKERIPHEDLVPYVLDLPMDVPPFVRAVGPGRVHVVLTDGEKSVLVIADPMKLSVRYMRKLKRKCAKMNVCYYKIMHGEYLGKQPTTEEAKMWEELRVSHREEFRSIKEEYFSRVRTPCLPHPPRSNEQMYLGRIMEALGIEPRTLDA